MMTLEKFEEASELVKKVTNSTKLVYSDYLSEQSGGKVYLKPENMQHTGAYKHRREITLRALPLPQKNLAVKQLSLCLRLHLL